MSKPKSAKDPGEGKFYALIHPGGPRGLLTKKPRMRKQDKRFKSGEFYLCVFFPKITQIGRAEVRGMYDASKLAQTPEAARMKFLDSIAQGETWETYHDAGHRIRKVRLVDCGDADQLVRAPKTKRSK